MRHTDAEINRFATAVARERSGGCSKTYHEIKQSLIDQLNKANENADDDEDPPDMNYNDKTVAEYERAFRFVVGFLVYGFLTVAVLSLTIALWASFVEVPQ